MKNANGIKVTIDSVGRGDHGVMTYLGDVIEAAVDGVGRVDNGVMTYLGDVVEAAVDGVGRVDEREDIVKDGGGRLLAEHVQHRDQDVGQKRRLSIKGKHLGRLSIKR